MRQQKNTSPKSGDQKSASGPFFKKQNNTALTPSPFFTPSVQAKLSIGRVDDPFEKEADAVADQVVQRSESDQAVTTPSPVSIQLKCNACGAEEEQLQRKEEEITDEEGKVQRKAEGQLMSAGEGETNESGPSTIQRKCSACGEEDSLQRKEEEITDEEGKVQRKAEDPMVSTEMAQPNSVPTSPNIQLKCDACGEEEELQRKEDEMPEEQIQRKATDKLMMAGSSEDSSNSGLIQRMEEEENAGESVFTFSNMTDEQEVPTVQAKSKAPAPPPASFQQSLQQSKGSGSPLSGGLKSNMENAFGADFGNVRLHTDRRAVQMSQQINAQAFTHGTDIYFNQGKFNPNNSSGKHLLAHELTHTIQQKGLRRKIIQRKPTNNLPLKSMYFSRYKYFRLLNEDDQYTMRKGHKNEYVRLLQQALLDLNYSLPTTEVPGTDEVKGGADGKFGKQTKKALKNFQRDAGFKGKEVDGILGHKTLRKLDKRFSSIKLNKRSRNFGGTGQLMVSKNIPVSAIVDRDEFLIVTLTHFFEISRDEAIKLTQGENKYYWKNFNGIDQADVDVGYMKISTDIDSFESIKGKIKFSRGRGKSPEEIEQSAKNTIFDLKASEGLYALHLKIEAVEAEILKADLWKAAGLLLMTVPTVLSSPFNQHTELDNRLKRLKDQRQKELDRLGITLQEFKDLIRNFLNKFSDFALLTAMRMLDQNETQTNIVQHKLKDINEVSKIQQVMIQLAPLYKKSDALWWKGVSEALTGHDDWIDNEFKLTLYVEGKFLLNGGIINPISGMNTLANVYKTFSGMKYDGKPINKHFKQAQALEKQAHGILNKGAKEHSILAYPDLEIRSNAQKFSTTPVTALQTKLLAVIQNSDKNGILDNIAKTKATLRKDTANVWKLKPVIKQAQKDLGILDGSFFDQIIKTEIKRREDAAFWRNIGLAALGIGLGLLALASGPIGWAALAGSIVVGSIDAYIVYQETSFLKTARRTALDPKNALSDVDPSWVWFYISLIGIGLDVVAAVKIGKVIIVGVKSAKTARELAEETTQTVARRLKELSEAGQEASEEFAQLQKIAKQIDSGKFEKNLEVLLKVRDQPVALVRLSEAMADENVATAIKVLGDLVGKDSDLYLKAIRYYGGIGNDFAEEMPELIRLIKGGNLQANKELMESLLTDPRIQKVVLDNSGDPKLILREWAAWKATRSTGKTLTFIDHLKAGGHKLDLAKGTKLIDEFGKGFSELSNVAKNRQLLRYFEPRLLDALEEGSALPAKVKQALEHILKDDLIGETSKLDVAGKRLMDALNKQIGGSLQTTGEFRKVMALLKNPSSRKTVMEAATSIPGQATYMRLLEKHASLLNPDKLDDLIRIGTITDENTLLRLIKEDTFRSMLVRNPDVIKVLKKCASPCFPPNATLAHIDKLQAILAKHPDADFAKLNEFFYQNRGSLKKLDDALAKLDSSWDDVMKGLTKTAGDISVPSKLTDVNSPFFIKALSTKLERLVAQGLSPSQLEAILRQISAKKINGTEIMELLSRATSTSKASSMKNYGTILDSLGRSHPERFKEAFEMLKKVAYSSRSTRHIDQVLTVLKMDDIIYLKTIVKEGQKLDMEKLYKIVRKVDGDRNDVIQLFVKSSDSTGEIAADANKIIRVLDGMGSGKHSVDNIAAEMAKIKAKPVLPDFNPADPALNQRFGNELLVEYTESMGKRDGWKKWMRQKLSGLSNDDFVNRIFKESSFLSKADPEAFAALTKIVQDGRFDRFNVLRALKNGADERETLLMLSKLNNLSKPGTKNVAQVLGDLAAGGNKFKGAWWMLKYIDSNSLWGSLRKFEFPEKVGSAGLEVRRYDALLKDGTYIQFKSWDNWSNSTFIKQFVKDMTLHVSDLSKLRWVFESTSGLKSKAEVAALIRTAINTSDNAVIVTNKATILQALDNGVFLRFGNEAI